MRGFSSLCILLGALGYRAKGIVMWSPESERFMSWPRTEDIRESICILAGRYTNRHHPTFDFNEGMRCYAFNYLILQSQGHNLSTYAQGVVNHWGRVFQIPSLTT